MLVKNVACLSSNGRTTTKHQNMQSYHVLLTSSDEYWCRLHAGTVLIQATRLVNSAAVIPHNPHWSSRKGSQALYYPFFDRVQYPTGHNGIRSDFQNYVRYSGIITEWTVILLSHLSVL